MRSSDMCENSVVNIVRDPGRLKEVGCAPKIVGSLANYPNSDENPAK
jgi:hypothetical protein